MPRKRKSKQQTSNKATAFSAAPKQGVGSTQDWVFNDATIVTLPQTANPGAFTVRVAADLNGLSWVISSNLSPINQYPTISFFRANQPYGNENNQFARLALLWKEYRINWVEIELMPTAAGSAISPTGVYSLVDETGTLQGNQTLGDLIPKISSQRTTSLHSPYFVTKRRFDFAKWIGQSQQKAWLLTQAPTTAQVVREFYDTATNTVPPDLSVGNTPALTMAFGVNSLSSFTSVIATIRFRVHYSFRQRVSNENGPVLDQSIRFSMDDSGRLLKYVDRERDEEEDTQGANSQLSTSQMQAIVDVIAKR